MMNPLVQFQTHFSDIGVLLISYAAAMGACFLLNQLCDVESDRHNRKLFIIAESYIRPQLIYSEVVVLIVISIALISLFGWDTLIIMTLFIVLTGYLYNFNPFKMKDRPWGSLFANALMGFLAFAIGWSASNSNLSELLIVALPYLFFNTALYIFTTLPDIEGDEKFKKQTLAVKYGVSRMVNTATLMYAISLFSAFWNDDKLAMAFIILSAPFFATAYWRKEIRDTMRATKFAILFFALAVCLRFPYYLIIMAAVFFLTRAYYKARFQFDYPNFKGV